MTMTQEDLEIRDIERALAGEFGHELGCFEWYAEVAIERGIVTDGDHDEITDDGSALMTRFGREMADGSQPCHCDVPSVETDEDRAYQRECELDAIND